MQASVRETLRKNPLITYLIITFAFSWSVFIPLALQKNGVMDFSVPFPIYYFASFGPLAGALCTTALLSGTAGLRELFGRMFRWRVGPLWWLVALSPLMLLGITLIILRIAQGEWFDIGLLGEVEFLPGLGIGALFLWLLTYGLGEETGWRGFALPLLQKNRSAMKATAILWIFWACWHAPAFFLVYDPAILPGFLLGLFAGAIVFTWLYNSTGGSLLMVIVWHGVFNFTTASKASKAGILSAVISTLVMFWAIVVVVKFKTANLSHREKHVL